MSVEALAVVLHHSRAKGTDKVVLLGIANHDGDGGAWPSVATLAKYANVAERNVQSALKRLQTLGEVVVHVQTGGPSGIPEWRRTNRYDVLVSCPINCDRSRNHRPIKLPSAPSDLWIDGVMPASPGDASDTPPVMPASPGGVMPASPEPSIEPTCNPVVSQVPQPQEGRPAVRSASCSICSLPELECRRRTAVSGHEFNSSSDEGGQR